MLRLMWALLGVATFVAAETTADESPTIALERGLNITVAIHQGGVDYEGLRTFDVVASDGVTIGFSWSEPEMNADNIDRDPTTRFVRREDLVDANRINATFSRNDPPSFPGSTAIQTSTAVLKALEADTSVAIVFGVALGTAAFTPRKFYRGTLRKVDATQFPVLVNGTRVHLPALHATGTLTLGTTSSEAQFWWLRQADNPLTLRWQFGGDDVQVVRIDTPEPQDALEDRAAAGLESDACRAELHGVYFDTGSATLLEASDAALESVAALLRDHPDWRVTIEGHTDGIGTDASNQDLSERRAAAVRKALIDRFGVEDGRLTSVGYGEKLPRETNDTLEGRARNRRVELSRECGKQS